jgi:hypothetical protein
MYEAPRDPLIAGLFVLALALALVILLGFGLGVLGDVIGLWQFDSGIGSENGDPPAFTDKEAHDA